MSRFNEPYFVAEPDVREEGYYGFAAGNDFNKEIVRPGINENYSFGAIAVRVDDDFWVVAALPYEEYLETSIQDIVKEFWPDVTNPTFNPDSIQEDID